MVDKYDSYYKQSVWFQVSAILDFFLLTQAKNASICSSSGLAS